MKSNKYLVLILSLFLLLLSAFVLAGCGGSTPQLNKDASLKTEWGALVQYKINDKWEEKSPSSLASYASVWYTTENNKLGIRVTINNPNNSTYKYSSTSTYSDWVKSEEKNHSDEGISSSLSSSVDAYKLPSYSDFTITEVGDKEAADITFRIYKETYTVSYSDKLAQEMKAKNPDFKQKEDCTTYYAVIKDGSHDMEISSSSDAILDSFLKTLSVKW